MRNLIKPILLILFLPTLIICQNTSQSRAPYKTMNLKFVLEATPTPEDVGFNNPKSFWQFRYELRFLSKDFKFEHFEERENESQKERQKRIRRNNKAHDKAWKKYGVLVSKGKVLKMSLLSAGNREIIIPVNLPSEITDILARAENTLENPYFRITSRGKVSTQTNSNLKFKSKFKQAFVCPTKIQTREAQYWMINTCGISIEVRKREDDRIVLGLRARI